MLFRLCRSDLPIVLIITLSFLVHSCSLLSIPDIFFGLLNRLNNYQIFSIPSSHFIMPKRVSSSSPLSRASRSSSRWCSLMFSGLVEFLHRRPFSLRRLILRQWLTLSRVFRLPWLLWARAGRPSPNDAGSVNFWVEYLKCFCVHLFWVSEPMVVYHPPVGRSG